MLVRIQQSSVKILVSCATLTAVLIGACLTASAQQTAARPDRGMGLGSYAISDIENINLTNGNVNLSILLASLPPIAGGKLSLGWRAVYNSKLWNLIRDQHVQFEPPIFNYYEDKIQQSDEGGWIVKGGFNIIVRESHDDVNWAAPHDESDSDWPLLNVYPNWFKTFLTTPDGAEHELKPLGFIPAGLPPYSINREYLRGYYKDGPDTQNPPASVRYYSFDGSFIWAKINPVGGVNGIKWEVYMPDGTVVYQRNNGVQHIQDTNGNKVRIRRTVDLNGVETSHIEDELTGREVTAVSSPASLDLHIFSSTVDGGSAESIIRWGTTFVYGKTLETSVQDPISGSCVLPTSMNPSSIGVAVVTDIILPQSEPNIERKFHFDYNSDGPAVTVDLPWYGGCNATANHITQTSPGWGEISKMTLPSGAVVNYSYDMTTTYALSSPDQLARARITTKTITHDNNQIDTWTYTNGVQGPDGSVTTEYGYPTDRGWPAYFAGPNGLGGLVYKIDYSGKKIVERRWINKKFSGADDTITGSGIARFNPVVAEEYTTLVGNPSRMCARTFQYDYNGNVTQETDYDWFDASLVSRDTDAANLPQAVPVTATVLRIIDSSYYNDSTASNSSNVYAKRQIGDPPTPLILNLPLETSVSNPSAALSRTQYNYDDGASSPLKGNLTEEKHRLIQEARWVRTPHTYDANGNRISTTDPNLNVTQFEFGDITHAQPTRITVDPNPLVTGDSQVTAIEYDYWTGLVKRQTDANGNITETDYRNRRFLDAGITKQDPFGRPGVVTSPAVTSTFDGQPHTNQQHTIVTRYFDNDRKVEMISDLKLNGDGLLKSRTSSDQLGRVVKNESSENGTSYTISSETVYKYKPGGQNGMAVFTTNPHRSSSDTTDGWTRTTQDVVGRTTEAATFSGGPGTLPPDTGCTSGAGCTGTVTSSYSAETTTVTDQAGKKRSSVPDCLGRLKQVFEDPTGVNLRTDYGYDALGNMTGVTQAQQTPAVTQTRTFIYDSLSRMTDSTNPESGHVAYTYDDNGNLKTKTDARVPAVTTTYIYDGLNRVTRRTYSDSTPQVDYYYDNQTLPSGAPSFTRGASIGRLVAVTYGGSASNTGNYQGYDSLGRAAVSHQKTDAEIYSMNYGYDLAGNMTNETYPSGKLIATEYDAAGRIAGVKRQANGMYYAGGPAGTSAIFYAAHGAVTSMRLGNGRIERTTFNSRLQPTQIKLDSNTSNVNLLQLDYGYGTTNNNGNVLSQSISVPGSGGLSIVVGQQNYTYDPLNRLSTAEELIGTTSQWKQTYDYDRWGNRAVRVGSYIPNPRQTPISNSAADLPNLFNQTNNRIIAILAGDATTQYDYYAGGNLKSMPNKTQGFATDTMGYDAENHQIKFNSTTQNYFYDGDGRRVKKIVGNDTTVFVYNVAGQLIAEYTSGTPGAGDTSYLTTDHLGSTRLVTDSGGNVKARHDYLPFGEEIGANIGSRSSAVGYGGTDSTKQKFTQKERDNESGLDYFLARYYSSAQGRFTSVDPENAGADSSDSQSWNGYAFARNSPVLYSDPDGRKYLICGPNGCGYISDEEFYRERDLFRPGNTLRFTGNHDFYESGSIYSQDGQFLASYQQVSIDAKAQELVYELRERFRDPATYKRAAINALIGIVLSRVVPKIARISPRSLTAAEEAAVNRTLLHIDAGIRPTGAVGKKWGVPFKNRDGDLPGGSFAASPYREYRVESSAGMRGAGENRIVVNHQTGEMYYTWTHYGDSGRPAFVKIR